ncbi:MAG TPA: hypothetical protein VGL59_10745 [Polyangia bacterium]
MKANAVLSGFLVLAATGLAACGPGAVGQGGSGGAGGAAVVDAGVDQGSTAGTGGGSGGSNGGTGGTGTGGAGSGGAAVVDAAPDGTGDVSSNCTVNGKELCEDFESGAINPKVWGMKTTTGTSLTVDGEHVHGGTHALHVKLVAGQSNTAQITDAVTFPATNNTFYTRAFIYVSPDLPFDMMGGFHMAYLLATGNNDLGFVEAGLATAGNKQYLGYSEYYGAGPDVHAHGPTFTEFGPDSSTRLVPQTWICLELMQGGNATTTMRRVWVNDKELPEQVSNFSDRKPPAFSLMSIGVLQYHPSPILTDIWIDDIRVSANKIGCGDSPDAGQ